MSKQTKESQIHDAFDALYDASDRDTVASQLLGDRGRVSNGRLFPSITLSDAAFKRIAKIAQYNRGERSFTISDINCRRLAEVVVEISNAKTATSKSRPKTKRETPVQRRERLWNYYSDNGDVAAANAIERTLP